MISADVQFQDLATPELRRIADQLKRPEALYKDVGRRAANDLRKHYAARESANPNKMGGRRTHFWLDVRDSVQQPALVSGGVDIVIAHPAIAAKIYGATVRPRNASALTIPINALAYGRRASVFESETGHELFARTSKKGNRILFAEINEELTPIYLLAKSARIPKDAQALPDSGPFVAGIVATAKKHFARQIARQ